MHLILEEIKIQPDQTTCFYGNRYGFNLKNGVATFSWLFLIGSFIGNDDIHKSLDEFEIRPDQTKDHRVSCP